MKLTTKILLTMLLLFITGIVLSNMALKNEFYNTDKNDIYWTYGKILEQPFSHLVIDGGNVTKIAYEHSKNASVRVYKDWYGYEQGMVKAHVKMTRYTYTFPIHIKTSMKNNGWNGTPSCAFFHRSYYL
ncbi:hypothetical protein BH11BAC6_BH11BAC6_04240 [soil metagenome]